MVQELIWPLRVQYSVVSSRDPGVASKHYDSTSTLKLYPQIKMLFSYRYSVSLVFILPDIHSEEHKSTKYKYCIFIFVVSSLSETGSLVYNVVLLIKLFSLFFIQVFGKYLVWKYQPTIFSFHSKKFLSSSLYFCSLLQLLTKSISLEAKNATQHLSLVLSVASIIREILN